MSYPVLPIVQVGDVLLSPDIFTERFCCDYEKCKGVCCVEGDAGAPVTLDEIGEIEASLNVVWHDLSATAQAMIDRQGVAYTDQEGDLVTSIVNGKDCVFTCYDGNNCMCALEKAYREKKKKTTDRRSKDGNERREESSVFVKPISCALYPIREKRLGNGTIALNYHRWEICKDGVAKGKALDLPLWKFLKEPLIRRFVQEWYDELVLTAKELTPHLTR